MSLKLYNYIIALFLSLSSFCFSQSRNTLPKKTIPISINLETEFSELIEGENIRIGITIQNIGETPFIIDTYGEYTNTTFKVYVRDNRGRLMFPISKISEAEEMMILPGKKHQFIFNLNDVFQFTKHGRYQVFAMIETKDAKAASNRKEIEIVNGLELYSVNHVREGIGLNEFFNYKLLYWMRDNKEHLFLKITNTKTGKQYGFVQLGSVIRVAKPEINFYPGNVVEILHQTTRDNFINTRISVIGQKPELISRDTLVNPAAIIEAESLRRAQEKLKENDNKENKGLFNRIF